MSTIQSAACSVAAEQRQVWFIPPVDKQAGWQVKPGGPVNTFHTECFSRESNSGCHGSLLPMRYDDDDRYRRST